VEEGNKLLKRAKKIILRAGRLMNVTEHEQDIMI